MLDVSPTWIIVLIVGLVIWVGLRRIHPEHPLYPKTLSDVIGCVLLATALIAVNVALLWTRFFGMFAASDIVSIHDAITLRLISVQVTFIAAAYGILIVATFGLARLLFRLRTNDAPHID